MWTFKVILSLLLGAIQGVLGLGCAWLLKLVTDIITGTNDTLTLKDFVIIAFVYYLVYIFVYWLSMKANAKAKMDIRTKIKEKLSKGLIWRLDGGHQTNQLGETISRFQYQVDAMESVYYEPLFKLIKNSMTVVIFLGVSIYLQWQITIVSLMVFAVFLFLTNSIQKKLNDYQAEIIEINEGESSSLVTMIEGFYTARDCGQEAFFLKRYNESARLFARANFKYEFLYDILASVSLNLEPIMTLIVIISGGILLHSGVTSVTIGEILGMTRLLSYVLGSIAEFAPDLSQVRSAEPIRDAFRDYENAGIKGEALWKEHDATLPSLEKISLQDVSYAYETEISNENSKDKAQEKSNEIVLEHVNLELISGKKYAIIGESGSGKTTLLKLIISLAKPSGGAIYWNDVSYSNVGKASILSRIAYVAQTPMIFHKHLKANILAGRDEDPNKLAAVMKQSKVDNFRYGFDNKTLLGLSARELSGGEKKRLAYARALYRGGEILILDEFTSAVHESMAEDLEAAMLESATQLVIHVTHTLNEKNLALYDAVFSVQDKHVVKVYPSNA